MKNYLFSTLAFTFLLLTACGSTPNTGDQSDRDLVHTRAQAALAEFQRADPSLGSLMNNAHAYAIFPAVISGAVGVGGAHGDGEVYQGGRMMGRADVSQGSIGFQLGGQKYAELVLFENAATLADFEHGTLEFDARANAVAASAGAGATAAYSHGVIVFTMQESGLMFQAAIGGQKFRYIPVQ